MPVSESSRRLLFSRSSVGVGHSSDIRYLISAVGHSPPSLGGSRSQRRSRSHTIPPLHILSKASMSYALSPYHPTTLSPCRALPRPSHISHPTSHLVFPSQI